MMKTFFFFTGMGMTRCVHFSGHGLRQVFLKTARPSFVMVHAIGGFKLDLRLVRLNDNSVQTMGF